MARWFLVLVTELIFVIPVAGRPVTREHVTLYDYLVSSDYSCRTAKHILKPSSLVGVKASENLSPACLVSHTCQPVLGVEAKSFTVGMYCHVENGVCEEPIDCARRSLELTDPMRNKWIGLRQAAVSSLSQSTSNKHGTACRETNGVRDKRSVLQFLSKEKVVAEACTTIYVCEGRPEPRYAACQLTAEKVCPQLNDCINNDLSFPGYTEKELQAMPAAERERVMRQFEAGGEEASSSSSSGGNSSTTSPHGQQQQAVPASRSSNHSR